jgi:hypothetical protein
VLSETWWAGSDPGCSAEQAEVIEDLRSRPNLSDRADAVVVELDDVDAVERDSGAGRVDARLWAEGEGAGVSRLDGPLDAGEAPPTSRGLVSSPVSEKASTRSSSASISSSRVVESASIGFPAVAAGTGWRT